MQFPSKVTPYKKSVLSLFPEIMGRLEQRDVPLLELMHDTIEEKERINLFIDALDCLFALGRIEIKDGTEVLHYVGRD